MANLGKFAFAVFLAVFAFQSLFVNSPGYPEAAVAAHAIFQGDVLYRDVWEMHAPGVFYLWASLFKLFGESLLVQKLAAITAYSLASAVLFLILARFVDERKAALVSFGYGAFVVLGLGELLVTQLSYTMLFVNLALYFAINYFDGKQSFFLFLTGASAGLAAIFKQNTGAYALAGIGVCVLLAAFRERKIVEGIRHGAVLVAGAFAALLPVGLFFAANNALNDLAYELFTNNLTEYVRREAVPPALTAPIWALGLGLLLLAVHSAFAKQFGKREKMVFASAAAGFFLLLVAYPRYTDAALYPAFGAFLIGLLAAGEGFVEERKRAVTAWLKRSWNDGASRKFAVAVVIFLLAFNLLVLGIVAAKTVYRTHRIASYALFGEFSYYMPSDLALYVNATLPADARIYQFGYDFDQLLSAGRRPIKHTFFLSGAIGGRNEQIIIDEIESTRVGYVLMNENAECEAGTSAGIFSYEAHLVPCREYVPRLYAHIKANYAEVKRFPSGWKLLRRGA